jgi:hypothetical protein
MLDMAKKKPRRGRPPAADKKEKAALYVEVDPALKAALDELAQQERRTLAAQVGLLLEEGLQRRGMWPRKPATEDN